MRHSLACAYRNREHHLLRSWTTLCNLTGVCILCLSYIESRRGQEHVQLSDPPTNTYIYSCSGRSRSAAIFTGSISNMFQCVGVPVTFNLLQTDFRLSCVSRPSFVDLLLQCTKQYCGRHQLEVEPALSIIVSSTLVASRGVICQQSIAREIMEKHANGFRSLQS